MISKGCEAERLMDIHELAEFLQVPESWIYARTADGRIPHKKMGRYVRFWLPDVIAWVGGDAA